MYINSSCIRINNTTVNFDNGIDGKIILMAISIEEQLKDVIYFWYNY